MHLHVAYGVTRNIFTDVEAYSALTVHAAYDVTRNILSHVMRNRFQIALNKELFFTCKNYVICSICIRNKNILQMA